MNAAAADLRAHILKQPVLTKATVTIADPLIREPLARANARLKSLLPAHASWGQALTSAHVLTAYVDEVLARPADATLRYVTLMRLTFALAEHAAYFERGERSLTEALAARPALTESPEDHADPLFASRAQLEDFLSGLFVASHFGHAELGTTDILRVGLGHWIQITTAAEVDQPTRLWGLSRGMMFVSIEEHDAPTDFRRESRRNFVKFQRYDYSPESAALWDALRPRLDAPAMAQAYEFFHEHAHVLSCASLEAFRATYGESAMTSTLGSTFAKACAPKPLWRRMLGLDK